MAANYQLESHFKHLLSAFKDAPSSMKQLVYELGTIVLKQDDRLNAVGLAIGADCIEADTNTIVEFMARAALKHADLAVIEFTAADYNVKHGFDGCPVNLFAIEYNQCVDILNLLECQPVAGGADYAFWQVFEPTTIGSEDEVSFTLAPDDRLLIDKPTGRMAMVRHYTNSPNCDGLAEGTYLFSLDVADKIKAIFEK